MFVGGIPLEQGAGATGDMFGLLSLCSKLNDSSTTRLSHFRGLVYVGQREAQKLG